MEKALRILHGVSIGCLASGVLLLSIQVFHGDPLHLIGRPELADGASRLAAGLLLSVALCCAAASTWLSGGRTQPVREDR